MAETVDRIAGRERGHTTSYLLDRAGHVSPGDQESRLANAADTGGSHQHRFTANEMPVPRVRTAGPHPHQHLRLTDSRRVDLDELQYVMGSAVLMLDDRLHHPSLRDPGQLAEPQGSMAAGPRRPRTHDDDIALEPQDGDSESPPFRGAIRLRQLQTSARRGRGRGSTTSCLTFGLGIYGELALEIDGEPAG